MPRLIDLLADTRRNYYPNPFFDVTNHYLPPELKTLFEWFEYIYMTNPLVAATINKFASYPVTEVVFRDAEDVDVVEEYRKEFDRIKWKEVLINAGIEEFVYGNSFVVALPRTNKYAVCMQCGNEGLVGAYQRFKLGSTASVGSGVCPRCGNHVQLKLVDRDDKERSPEVFLWNPKIVSIKRHPLTGEERIFSEVPQALKAGILNSDVFIVQHARQEIIEAVKRGKLLEFDPNHVFHLKRNALSGRYQEWGLSALFPVIKNIMLTYIYRKANEAIAFDHILPLRIIFPQPFTNNSDPAVSIDLGKWRDMMEEVIEEWRRDPNLILTSPIPVGETQIGGTGKVLEVTPLIQQITQEILAGLGVPQEFVFGGLTWSGSSVSLRMLENQMANYVGRLNRLLQFLADQIAAYKDLPKVTVKLKPFRMADDNQRKSVLLSLADAGYISRQTLLEEFGLNYEEELEKIKQELMDLQEIQQMQAPLQQVEEEGEAPPVEEPQSEAEEVGAEQDFNPVQPEREF